MKAKRLLSMICAIVLLLTAVPTSVFALERPEKGSTYYFNHINLYKSGQFTDVPPGAWCEEDVKKVYRTGIMGGKSESFFDAKGNITIAQSIVIAARIFCIYYKLEEPSGSADPWYANHLALLKDYEVEIKEYDEYNVPITRAEFAQLLRNVFAGRNMFTIINYVDDGAIPDVSMDSEYAETVYELYRAGVLTGSDAKGTFYPEAYLSRGAAAAIIARVVYPPLRKPVVLSEKSILIYAEQNTIAIGEETRVVARAVPSTITYEQVFAFTSLNPKVATVDAEGRVIGVSSGTTTIVATHPGADPESVEITVDPNHTPAVWYDSAEKKEYVVGKDIPAGKYFLMHADDTEGGKDGSGLYEVFNRTGVSYENMYVPGEGWVDAVNKDRVRTCTTGSFTTFSIVEVKNGQTIVLQSEAKAVALENAPVIKPNSDGYYWPGTYLVGTTLPAGTYRASKVTRVGLFSYGHSEVGYWSGHFVIYTGMNSHWLDDARKSSMFFLDGGLRGYGAEMTVKDGQIFAVSGTYFSAAE